jgi:hypothetical protein
LASRIPISAHYWITNWNPARSKALPYEIRFYEAKVKLQKFTGIKGPIRKIKKNP